MGRGKGKYNLSEEELRSRRNKRKKEFYDNNKERLRCEDRKRRANAGRISCGCGGSYTDLPNEKMRHFDTIKHQLYENELKAVELLNILDFDDDKAITKINELCNKHDKYTTLDKCNYIGEKLISQAKKQIKLNQSKSESVKLEVNEKPNTES